MYSIFEEWPKPEWEERMDINLFTKKRFWELRISETEYLPLLLKNKSGEIISFWCFAKHNNEWKTPYKAPYFEPYISNNVDLVSILSQVFEYLKRKSNQKISFTLPPTYYGFIFQSLTGIEGTIKNVEIANYLPVSADKSFTEIIQQKRKKRKLLSLLGNNDYSIKEAEKNEWEKLYNQLLHWRQLKNHKNLITTEWMAKAKAEFPHHYRCLTLSNSEEIIGQAYFLHVKSTVLYIYALITNPNFDNASPALLLWNALYELSRREGIEFIDMGTSMKTDLRINRSLLRNKTALGGQMAKKYTLTC